MTTQLFSIQVFEKTRQTVYDAVSGLSTAQLLKVPTGFANNILWNVGHIIVLQQAWVYTRSGFDTYSSPDLNALFWARTSPDDWVVTPEPAPLIEMLVEHSRLLAADYAAGKFADVAYQERTSGSGIHQTTVEHAINYNNYHEGLHLGAILALKAFL